MADSARHLHGGVYRLAPGLIHVTRRTIVFLVENAGVFDGAGVHSQGQKQKIKAK
jgi:hypothetical protein